MNEPLPATKPSLRDVFPEETVRILTTVPPLVKVALMHELISALPRQVQIDLLVEMLMAR